MLDCSLLHVISVQEFLNDYGMLWVGKEEAVDDREVGNSGGQRRGQPTGAVWNPEASVAEDPTATPTVNFDVIVKNIKVLNNIICTCYTYIHVIHTYIRILTCTVFSPTLYSTV